MPDHASPEGQLNLEQDVVKHRGADMQQPKACKSHLAWFLFSLIRNAAIRIQKSLQKYLGKGGTGGTESSTGPSLGIGQGVT